MKNTIIITFLLAPLISLGVIEPVIIKLELGGESYTVPANKVLVIENVLVDEELDSHRSAYLGIISDGVTNAPMRLKYISTFYFDKPLKIPPASVLFNAGGQYYPGPFTIFCLLVDPSDLYVRIDNQSGNMLVQDNTFSFDVVTASPRPARIAVESSNDLATWQPADTTIEKMSPVTYTISIPVEDEVKYFARYTVRGIVP